MRFEFATATRIIFGSGTLREVGAIAHEFGRRAFVVTGSSPDRAQPVMTALRQAEISYTTFPITGEPTLAAVTQGIDAARKEQCDFVIGFGGGSALDAGKTIAAMLANEGELMDYVEVIGRGRALQRASLPCIAIPTTAGTGAEVTRNAVLASPEHRVKVSLRSPHMLPRVALVDPELTLPLPPEITASTGLDALTQLIEPYVSSRATPMTDALCLDGIRHASISLPRVFRDGRDLAARKGMSLASLFGGLALANAGLGAVHGFAAPIGGMFPAPHGAVCAALLPHAMEINIRAATERDSSGKIIGRFTDVARLLLGSAKASAGDGTAWVGDLVEELQIPPLSAYGIQRNDMDTLIEKAMQASSMKANPLTLTRDELVEILERAL